MYALVSDAVGDTIFYLLKATKPYQSHQVRDNQDDEEQTAKINTTKGSKHLGTHTLDSTFKTFWVMVKDP